MKHLKTIISSLFILITSITFGQKYNYSTANAHSHNDYENVAPFTAAYDQTFGSIEADIFYFNDSLFVGHTFSDIQKKRTLNAFYLEPLNKKLIENNQHPYADSSMSLQLLIDIKTDPLRTIHKLIEQLQKFPNIITSKGVKIVITGNRPKQNEWTSYPSYIYFDGDLDKNYSTNELIKVGLFSADFTQYSNWNGKGIMVKADHIKIDSIISAVHQKGKKIRFWASPDYANSWIQFMKMKVDYINTDHIQELGKFLKSLASTSAAMPIKQATYLPKYSNDGVDSSVHKIILLIGDGCSLPQWYAGYTANGGSLTTFNLKHLGFSKTSSADNYVTDSAPGASSMATGEKIENRHLGIDPNGKNLNLLTDYLAVNNFNVGLISSGDVSDATPAAFFARALDRDSSIDIIAQLNHSNVQILAGAGNDKISDIGILQKKNIKSFSHHNLDSLLPNYDIVKSINELNTNTFHKTLVLDNKAGLSIKEGRGTWLSTAFENTATILAKKATDKFFIMTEAAQIDYGGHANNLQYVVNEVLDFDLLISKAIEYADTHKGTLVIITGDHETGGLTLQDGDYKAQMVHGNFSTNDHTGIPVPVFSYGYRSYLFDGIYENTEIFNKIKAAIK